MRSNVTVRRKRQVATFTTEPPARLWCIVELWVLQKLVLQKTCILALVPGFKPPQDHAQVDHFKMAGAGEDYVCISKGNPLSSLSHDHTRPTEKSAPLHKIQRKFRFTNS